MKYMPEATVERFWQIVSETEFCSIRLVREQAESLGVRQNILQPTVRNSGSGAMLTVLCGSGAGYCGTADLSQDGLERALRQATFWADLSAEHGVTDFSKVPFAEPQGNYQTLVQIPWQSVPLCEKIQVLSTENNRLKTSDRIVDWEAEISHTECDVVYATNRGGYCRQQFSYVVPALSVTANSGTESQTRTFGGRGVCRQGGFEVLKESGFYEVAPVLSEEAERLVDATDCPTGVMEVLLAPDQMILQVHESIGHPLELDRILGDERNYAGTSFVTPEMFGTYQYGSDLLNVVFDPQPFNQYASYKFDDEGLEARKRYLIKDGKLLRGLGGTVSQARSGLPGVANARASSWNRPPIDRMANINLEPGAASVAEMIASIEHGVYMKTNCSWSIDDSRNKFQFGCELGQVIKDGELKHLVKKPNYRGVSANFWRTLRSVGDSESLEVLGTPFCGKGEPNQVIRVGHAAPACVFSEVEVFGGD